MNVRYLSNTFSYPQRLLGPISIPRIMWRNRCILRYKASQLFIFTMQLPAYPAASRSPVNNESPTTNPLSAWQPRVATSSRDNGKSCGQRSDMDKPSNWVALLVFFKTFPARVPSGLESNMEIVSWWHHTWVIGMLLLLLGRFLMCF